MSPKKNLLSVLVLLLVLGGSLALIFRAQDPSLLLSSLRCSDPLYLLLGCGLMALFVGLEALQTFLTLRAMSRPTPYRQCLCFSTAGFYFSSITPSSTGGQPAQVFYMTRLGIPAAVGALDLLLLTVCYQLVSLLYALCAWRFAPRGLDSLPASSGVFLGYGFAVTAFLTLCVLAFLLTPTLARGLFRRLLSLLARLRLLRDLPSALAALNRQIADYRSALTLLRRRIWLFPVLLALCALQMTALYLVPWTVYAALGLSGASAAELLSTQALLSVAVGTLPIPGAVGASEAGFLSAFRCLFPAALVTPAMLLSRALSFYLPLLLSGVSTLLLHLKTLPASAPNLPDLG